MPANPTQNLTTIEFESAPNPKVCMVVLHGLGANKTDLVPLIQQLKMPVACRFVFAEAPLRPISMYGEDQLRAWYDLTSPNFAQNPDVLGADQSVQMVHALIQQQQNMGLKTLVLGYSQGGVIAIRLGLQYHLSGVIALSAYLLEPNPLKPKHIHPWFLAHGQQDPVIPLALGNQAQQQLKNMGCTVQWHHYPMEHSIVDAEIQDLNHWLGSVF